MQKLNIVIISRTIFPQFSPRSFRATELAKELARRGHKVTLYAVLGKYDYSDFQKETGIIVKNIGNMLFATSDSENNFRYNLLDKMLYHSLHRIIEFPDIELTMRIPHILKKEKKCNMLITIAAPHAIHWGAAIAKAIIPKKKFPETWISDCGDPYIGNSIEKKNKFIFKPIEKLWGRKTDYITIPIEAARKGYYPEFSSKIKVIPQGFDFSVISTDNSFIKNDIPTFAYAGSIIPGFRDPTVFLNYISSLNCDFRFIVFTTDAKFYLHFKKVLKNKIEIRQYLPREQLIYELSRMDFLINFTNPSTTQAPSKIIDYLLAKRPILDISKDFIEVNSFNEFLDRNYKNQRERLDISQFDIKNVTDQFLDLYYENKR